MKKLHEVIRETEADIENLKIAVDVLTIRLELLKAARTVLGGSARVETVSRKTSAVVEEAERIVREGAKRG